MYLKQITAAIQQIKECLQRKLKITTNIDNKPEAFDKQTKNEGIKLIEI